jgi:hypothetical protein
MDVPVHDRDEPGTVEVLREDAYDGFTKAAAVAETTDRPFFPPAGRDRPRRGVLAPLRRGGQSRPVADRQLSRLFDHSLLETDVTVEDGSVSIPDAPGLGHDIDRDVLEELQVELPDAELFPPD